MGWCSPPVGCAPSAWPCCLPLAHARGDILLTMAAQAAAGLLALTVGEPADTAHILLGTSARDWHDTGYTSASSAFAASWKPWAE